MAKDLHEQKILILDFGSQYTQLIARRVRESQVYCEIHPFNVAPSKIRAFNPKGLILSGGPASIYDRHAPQADREILKMGIPILGICYGMQYLTHILEGQVARAEDREYGSAVICIEDDQDLFRGFGLHSEEIVWMSHGDRIERMPKGFSAMASSKNSPSSSPTVRRPGGTGKSLSCATTPESVTVNNAMIQNAGSINFRNITKLLICKWRISPTVMARSRANVKCGMQAFWL